MTTGASIPTGPAVPSRSAIGAEAGHSSETITGPFAFCDSCGSGVSPTAALDRADHLRDDPAALAALWPQARVLLLDDTGNALVDEDRRLWTPAGAALDEDSGEKVDALKTAAFLGIDGDGQAWFALDAAPTGLQAPHTLDLRSAAALWPARDAAAFAQARALQHWRLRHRHCGACGGAVAIMRAGWAGRCTQCALEHYPRTDPAVIVAVGDGQRLLLGRQSTWPARRYSVIAGFVEPGESLEQAVAREVMEETGLRIRSCRYLASQPWPFPGALMLGFAAEAEPGEPQVSAELEEARWFTVDEIRAAQARDEIDSDDEIGPLLSARISIARWLIEQWLAEACNAAPAAGALGEAR